jgi:hypothetical protein
MLSQRVHDRCVQEGGARDECGRGEATVRIKQLCWGNSACTVQDQIQSLEREVEDLSAASHAHRAHQVTCALARRRRRELGQFVRSCGRIRAMRASGKGGVRVDLGLGPG